MYVCLYDIHLMRMKLIKCTLKNGLRVQASNNTLHKKKLWPLIFVLRIELKEGYDRGRGEPSSWVRRVALLFSSGPAGAARWIEYHTHHGLCVGEDS